MNVIVTNLATGNTSEYTCNARQAVIAAHAQSKGDWNTWEYETKYGADVRQTPSGRYWNIGDHAAPAETT